MLQQVLYTHTNCVGLSGPKRAQQSKQRERWLIAHHVLQCLHLRVCKKTSKPSRGCVDCLFHQLIASKSQSTIQLVARVYSSTAQTHWADCKPVSLVLLRQRTAMQGKKMAMWMQKIRETLEPLVNIMVSVIMPIQRYSVYELVGLTTKRRNSVLDMLLSPLLAAAARGDSQRKNSVRHVWKVEQKCSTVWSSAYDAESKTAFLAAKNFVHISHCFAWKARKQWCRKRNHETNVVYRPLSRLTWMNGSIQAGPLGKGNKQLSPTWSESMGQELLFQAGRTRKFSAERSSGHKIETLSPRRSSAQWHMHKMRRSNRNRISQGISIPVFSSQRCTHLKHI